MGSPPENWSGLMTELMVTDFPASLDFWTNLMGFAVCFDRPAQKFACIEHPCGAQMMIYERDGDWETGPMDQPFGRGAVIQIYVADVAAIHARFVAVDHPLYVPLRDKWRDWGDRLGSQREFLVQDPDGYLVMIAQRIGERAKP